MMSMIYAISPSGKGYFEMSAVYAEPNGRTIEHTFKQHVRFIKTPRGRLSQYTEDSIMKLEGATKTFAEEPEEARTQIWSKNFIKIAKQLAQEWV
jgi:hypothetical protein